MKADKKDKFKNLLKLTADEQPSAGFTASIMQAIEADVQREAALKAILQKEEAVGPSFSFTANVMAGIKASQPKYVYKPIISRKAWYGIAAIFTVLVALAMLPGPAQHTATSQGSLATLIGYTYAIQPIYCFVFVIIVALLMADYLVGRSRNKTTGHAV